MNNQHINLTQARDFGELLQDSIKFVFANIKIYLKSIIFFAGPFFLISAILSAMMLKDFTEFQNMDIQEVINNPDYILEVARELMANINWGIYGLLMLSTLASSLILMLVVNGTIVAHNENVGAEINVDMVKNKVSTYFLPYLGLTFLLALAFLAVYVGGILVVFLSSKILSFLAGLVGFALVLLLIYAAIAVYMTYIIRMEENIPNTSTFKRAFTLIKGHWWETFGLILVLGILLGIVGGIIGGLISLLFLSMGSISGLVVFGTLINNIIGGIMTAIILTAVAMQYYNLRVKKEGYYSDDHRIDEIGREANQEETF